MNLLGQVSCFQNLHAAFLNCSRGKRSTLSYMETLFGVGERLLLMNHQLRAGEYFWGEYRDFYVTDPKKRLITAAPFIDRIVHHAIYQVVDPIIDKTLSDSVFACRKEKGNRYAVLYLKQAVDLFGQNRYVIKLDVKKYFMSISHEILMREFEKFLPDMSLEKLLKTLLESYPQYAKAATGIPIGNLTSQLFANFYLSSADSIACQMLNLDYNWLKNQSCIKDGFYLRYMDDLVILAKNKKTAKAVADALCDHTSSHLKLEIPFYKRVSLSSDPIPFLGYLVCENGIRPLSRNHRRHRKSMKRLEKHKALPSKKNQVKLSYEAWCNIEGGKKPNHTLMGCLRGRCASRWQLEQ